MSITIRKNYFQYIYKFSIFPILQKSKARNARVSANRENLRKHREQVDAEIAKMMQSGEFLNNAPTTRLNQIAVQPSIEHQLSPENFQTDTGSNPDQNERLPTGYGQASVIEIPNYMDASVRIPVGAGRSSIDSISKSMDAGGNGFSGEMYGNTNSEGVDAFGHGSLNGGSQTYNGARNAETGQNSIRSREEANIPRDNAETGTRNPDYLDNAFAQKESETVMVFEGYGNTKNTNTKAVKKFIRENKPKYSPRIDRWLDKEHGKVTIKNIEGIQVWKYEDHNGDYAYYYQDGEGAKVVFPKKYVCLAAPTVNIGEFSNSRGKDRSAAMNFIEEKFKTCAVVEGFIPHHTYVNGIIQFVDKDVHRKFSHCGGFSKRSKRRK